MKLARYWTRESGEAIGPDGRRVRATSRGWSDQSLEGARAVARDVARRVAERIASHPADRKQYLYGERPLPEPILREFQNQSQNSGDGPQAVITRNLYGALVMNSRDLMFVDIDREQPALPAAASLVSGLLSLFGKSAPATSPPTDPVINDIQRVAARHSLSGRAYKTAAGYRALITSQRFDAGSPASESLLQEFGADPLYIRLCRMQQSFRARLTPKPWRCGLPAPPVSFPFETAEVEARMRAWEAKYTATTAGCATCHYLAAFGSGGVEPAFEELVQYHDRETKATSALPLA